MRLLSSLLAALGLGLLMWAALPEAPDARALRGDDAQPAALSDARAARVETRRYIVELRDPPLAQYTGGIGKLRPTAAWLTGEPRLDVDAPDARAYLAHLAREQEAAKARIRSLAPDADFGWRYRYVLNGVSARLSPAQAARVAGLPGVRHVQAAERYEPEMDGSLVQIGAPEAYAHLGGIAQAGLGVRIAILDGGQDIAHPMFRDEGMPPAPEGFPAATMHLRSGRVLAYPEPARYVNDKVIAARIFVGLDDVPEDQEAQLLEQLTPLGRGHGLHVAGIAGGRAGRYETAHGGQQVQIELSGVAPMAQLLNYKTDYASSPEYVAMMDRMVEDRVDVFNMSEGHGIWLIDRPETHPMSRAMAGAFDAGILPVVAAGNAAANGRSSLSGAFKYNEKVLAVANVSAPGSFDVPIAIDAPGLPITSVLASPIGDYVPEAPIDAELFLAPEGGCVPAPGMQGRIVIVDRLGAGDCGVAQRRANLVEGGATAVVFYYDDRPYAGFVYVSMPLPSLAIGTVGGRDLVAWLAAGGQGRAVLADRIQRGLLTEQDLLDRSSSLGPGLEGQLKPDIAAPGTGIFSSTFDEEGGEPRPSIGALTGTSMAAPQVAGAAALLRSAHPDWTSSQLRSALLTSSVRPGTGLAPYEMGVGRLDLRGALDPGALVEPPKAAFGRLTPGEPAELRFQLRSVSEVTETWSLEVASVTGTLPVVSPSRIELAPGAEASFVLRLDAGAAQPEHWGDVVLRRDEAGALDARSPLRLAYYGRTPDHAEDKDVLVVSWAQGRTLDRVAYYTETLEALGLSYDVWRLDETSGLDHPTLDRLQAYDLVILNQNESTTPLQLGLPAGAYQYLNALLSGGNALIAGQGTMNWWRVLGPSPYPDVPPAREYCGAWWPKCFVAPDQTRGCDMCLPRYFAGFTFGVTATLTGRVLEAHERPLTPTRQVILPPHPDADGPFRYALDLSTGALAPDGAAGNQYAFASGSLLEGYVPDGERAVDERDGRGTEGVFERLAPHARPLWSYTGPYETETGASEVMTKVVGSYVAGRQAPEADIAWNAMFWGFGLEGVGKGAEGTVGRERLLGDAFNFLARNLDPGRVNPVWEPAVGLLRLDLPDLAEPPLVARVEVDWGDGMSAETIEIEPPARADVMRLAHVYAREGRYRVALDLFPAAGAAPMYGIQGDIETGTSGSALYLPAASAGP